jgi:hypothetical protein
MIWLNNASVQLCFPAHSRYLLTKSKIIAQLGQTDILLPFLIAEGLCANDRVKARLSVLQATGRHARDPKASFDLAEECRMAGLDPVAMEALVNRARLSAGEHVTGPGLNSLETAIWDDVTSMIRAVNAAVSGTEAAATGVAAAAEMPEGNRADSEDALAAVGRLIDAEHRADAAEREVMRTVMQGEFDLKTALSVIDLARTLERATDRLASPGRDMFAAENPGHRAFEHFIRQ